MAQIGSFLLLGAFLSTQITTSDAAFACDFPWSLKADQSNINCTDKDCGILKCCEADSTSCLGAILSGALSCGSTKRSDSMKTGSTIEDCCLDKTLCSASACSAGWKLKADAASTLYCTGATCTPGSDRTTCCDKDSTKCRSHTCGDGKGLDSTKNGDTGATDALCCKDLDTCASVTPPVTERCAEAGMQYDTTKAAEIASPSCCKADASKCASVTCAAGTYRTDAATGTTTEQCCTNLPTCSSYVAPAPTPSPGPVAEASGAQQFASTHHTFAMLFCVLISSVKQL